MDEGQVRLGRDGYILKGGDAAKTGPEWSRRQQKAGSSNAGVVCGKAIGRQMSIGTMSSGHHLNRLVVEVVEA